MSEKQQGINLPVDDDTVRYYLNDATFKASVDLFVTEVWPTYLAGLKAKAAVRAVEHDAAMERAMKARHPLYSVPGLSIVPEVTD